MTKQQMDLWVRRNCKFAQFYQGESDAMSTESEMDMDDAKVKGYHRPDQAWILSDRDVWYANPYYKGPPVPHPEDYNDDVVEVAPNVPKPVIKNLTPPEDDPKIPF